MSFEDSPRSVCRRISIVLKAAEDAPLAVDHRLWTHADRFLTEIGTTFPQILLPSEFEDRIVRMRLPMFPTELWRLVASYAASHNDIVTVRLQTPVLARISCLLLSGGRTDDAFTLLEPLISDVGSFPLTADNYDIQQQLEHLARLMFVVGRFETCATMHAAFLITGKYAKPADRTSWMVEESISRSFGGSFGDAVRLTIGWPTTAAGRWPAFASCLAVLPTENRSDTLRRLLDLRYQPISKNPSGFYYLLNAILDELLIDTPPVLDDRWLRTAHAAALTKLDDSVLRMMPMNLPRFVPDDLGPADRLLYYS